MMTGSAKPVQSLTRWFKMVIELGRASETTKGQIEGPFPEFEALTFQPWRFTFDDTPLWFVAVCPDG